MGFAGHDGGGQLEKGHFEGQPAAIVAIIQHAKLAVANVWAVFLKRGSIVHHVKREPRQNKNQWLVQRQRQWQTAHECVSRPGKSEG